MRCIPNDPEAQKSSIVKEHLAMVGLTEAMDKTPPQIPGGMKQRVSIARALAIRPEVLILMNLSVRWMRLPKRNYRKNC